MKKISILKYDLKKVPVTKKTLIHRALYGYIDHSNKGSYTYVRKGALDTLKYTKISDSVLMMSAKDVESIVPLFKKYKIKVHIMNLIMP